MKYKNKTNQFLCLSHSLFSLLFFPFHYIYPHMCVCRFRLAPHRWLSTFCMPINQRVSNSTLWQQRLTHQQKVSYRTPIVSISRSLAPLFGTCLYWRDQFPLCLSLSLCVFRLCPQGGLFFRSIRLIHRQVRLLPSHHCHCPSYDDQNYPPL